MPRAANVPNRYPGRSDQEQVDQRAERGAHAGGDQGVVGGDVGLRVERWLGFLSHSGRLGQPGGTVCEPDHIRLIFSSGNGRKERVDGGRIGNPDGLGIGYGPAASTMAIGRRREILAVDADRHHGTGFPFGTAQPAL